MGELLATDGIPEIILIELPVLSIQLYHRVQHQPIISEIRGLIQVHINEE